MAVQLLKDTIRKMKMNDMHSIFPQWSFLRKKEQEHLKSTVLPDADGSKIATARKRTKAWIASYITEICQEKGGLTMDHAAELDLMCMQLYSSKRQWQAYQLSDKLVTDKAEKWDKSPGEFQKKLLKHLQLYFSKSCSVCVQLYDRLLWVRVYLPQPGVTAYQPTRCMYFIHYPQTPLVLMSGLKVSWKKSLQQCLLLTLGYKEMTEMYLVGHHFDDLAQLALNKFSQGGLLKFGDASVMGRLKPNKRKALEEIHSDNIHDENGPAKRRRLENLDEEFGKNVLPALEKLTFKVELRYRSKDVISGQRLGGQPFNCRVEFKGKNVLEGIREVAARGYARCPLPKHLSTVPSRGRNFFKLANSRRNTSLTHG